MIIGEAETVFVSVDEPSRDSSIIGSHHIRVLLLTLCPPTMLRDTMCFGFWEGGLLVLNGNGNALDERGKDMGFWGAFLSRIFGWFRTSVASSCLCLEPLL